MFGSVMFLQLLQISEHLGAASDTELAGVVRFTAVVGTLHMLLKLGALIELLTTHRTRSLCEGDQVVLRLQMRSHLSATQEAFLAFGDIVATFDTF